jgi:hypothetical protein
MAPSASTMKLSRRQYRSLSHGRTSGSPHLRPMAKQTSVPTVSPAVEYMTPHSVPNSAPPTGPVTSPGKGETTTWSAWIRMKTTGASQPQEATVSLRNCLSR